MGSGLFLSDLRVWQQGCSKLRFPALARSAHAFPEPPCPPAQRGKGSRERAVAVREREVRVHLGRELRVAVPEDLLHRCEVGARHDEQAARRVAQIVEADRPDHGLHPELAAVVRAPTLLLVGRGPSDGRRAGSPRPRQRGQARAGARARGSRSAASSCRPASGTRVRTATPRSRPSGTARARSRSGCHPGGRPWSCCARANEPR
jgi:hypothetical protein